MSIAFRRLGEIILRQFAHYDHGHAHHVVLPGDLAGTEQDLRFLVGEISPDT
jgi:hypothetical protein